MRIARFAASIASLAVLLALVGLGGCSSAGSGTPGLQSVEVTPPNSHAAAGTSEQLAATAVYSDGSHQDVTMLVTWSSSDTSQATVTASGANGGLVTALTPGAVKITAALKGMTGSTGLTVTPAVLVSLEVTPATPSVPRGVSKQFVAMGVFSDHSTQNLTTQVTWASANTAVATVSNTQGSQGLANGAALGTAAISASMAGISGSTTLTVTAATLVTIQVTPANPTVANGLTEQFTATGVYTDNSTQNLTTQVTWSSSNAAAATVSNTAGSQGLASSGAPGSSSITATSGSISGGTTLNVTAATLVSIAVTPANPSIANGLTEQFTATGTYTDNSTLNITTQVTWSSSNSVAATVSNASGSQGLASTAAPGSTTVTATTGGVSGSTGLTVTTATLVSIAVGPTNPSVADGYTEQFTATGVYTDNSTQDLTTQVTWSSGDPTAATISNASGSQGLASTVAPGVSLITATSGSISGGTDLTVTAAALVSIAVTPAHPSIANGLTEQFTATGTYSDNSTKDLTTQVTWASSTTTAATISNASGSQGLASSAAPGSTTITATSGAISGSTGLTITAATLVSIAVTPASPGIANGLSEQFTATGTYTDNTTQNLTTQVTWASSDTTAATISNASGSQGLASSVAQGGTTITATSGAISGSTGLTVTAATLVSIQVTPPNPSIANGLNAQFTATGIYTDNTTQNLTTQVTWSSSNASAATVSNVSGSQGLATSAGVGSTTISATSGSVSGSTALTVSAATLVSIAVTPANSSIANGLNAQFTATGTYTDNSTLNITTQVTWSSSNTTAVTISNAAGSQGLASSAATGGTTITATSGSVSGSTGLTITAATLVSIAVTPANPSVANGLTEQFSATGTYTDNSTLNLTTQVTWSSSDTGTATVSNAAGSQGLASTAAPGSTTITATSGSVSGNTGLTVTAATLVSIAITPANPSIAAGLTQQFTATGTYTDNSTQDITTQVTWNSSNTAAATVSNASGSQGLASSGAPGSTTITASDGSVSNTTVLSVTVPGWTWMSGSNVGPGSAVYGTQGVAAAGNTPGGREGAASWTDRAGNFWLFGGVGFGTSSSSEGMLSDLWMYSPATQLWTWMGGTSALNSAGVYGTQNVASAANRPGAREYSAFWTDRSGNFWLFGGAAYGSSGEGYDNDLWMYNPSTQLWTWVNGPTVAGTNATYGTQGVAAAGNIPGGRISATSAVDSAGRLWLFGGYGYTGSAEGYLGDLWMFDPSTQLWTWVSGTSATNGTPVFGTQGTAAPGNTPGSRYYPSSWTDGNGNFWLFGGYNVTSTSGGQYNDLWVFSPTTNLWTWVTGSATSNAPGVYGTQGVAAASNTPSARYFAVARTDSTGNFWLFGGAAVNGYSSDLWTFNPSTQLWTWVSGFSSPAQAGIYGTRGTPAAGNAPGGRYGGAAWMDSSNNFWLFGGFGLDSAGNYYELNDLWEH
jgi:hypothetical protein